MANPSVTSVSNWKKPQGEEVTLPSGNTCLVRRPGMEKLFSAGVLPDNLTKIAIESVEKAQAGGRPQDHKSKGPDEIDPEVMKKFLDSENAISDIFMSFDRITEMCVVAPEVRWHMKRSVDITGNPVEKNGKQVFEEIPSRDRDEEVLYTDDIDMEDKTFIFNFVVGGTRDLETFREEYGDALADVSPRENVELSPE